MDHQSELEKTKYRNWVRGGLAYKYLKSGVESFVDEIVQQEHSRILSYIKHTPGLTCDRCSIQTLKPLHKSEKHPVTAGKDICPKGQTNCNCLFPKKQKCRNNICDAIFEEVLNSHGSTPPAPNWKNTNIQNWCSMPWEIAKCFINSPGYSDKVSACDTDISGLLHVLINNINLHEHFSVNIYGNGIFKEAIEGRNTIFHSPVMELEDHEVNKYYSNIIAILEDEKELKSKEDSKLAVVKLKQLKDRHFIITTHDEVEVCRDAMASINNKSEELKQMIHDAKDDIDVKQMSVLKAFDDKSEKALADALDELDQRCESQLQVMKRTTKLLIEKIRQVEIDSNEMNERLTKIEHNVDRLNSTYNIHQAHLEYVQQKQEFQGKLVTLYEKHHIKTWISPFKVQDKDVNINEVYVTPNMIVKEETSTTTRRVNTENVRAINKYQDIFQTNGRTHKKIYIIGDGGTGKKALGKMMILNWCKACKALKDDDEDVEQMRRFDFLFFIPLQRISGFSYNINDMIEAVYKDFASKGLIERIVEQDGERCLIIADGLDEWTPPKTTLLPHHVSFGMPKGDGIRNATFITLSRSSAKGILNMNSTEFDQKIVLLGIKPVSKNEFTRKYMSKLNKNEETIFNEFMKNIEKSNLHNLERTPFLLQQLIWMYCNGDPIGQSVSDIYSKMLNIIFRWCESKEEEEDSEDEISKIPEDLKQIRLPNNLQSIPKCERDERLIFLLSKLSFVALTDEIIRGTFGRSELRSYGIKKADIATFLKLGILVEYDGFDQTYETTYVSFVHITYLEFFAAVYMASHCTEQRNIGEAILEKLFMKFESAVDILQFSNLLKMMCGLSPLLTEEISKLISRTVRKDKSMTEYRKNLHQLHKPRLTSKPQFMYLLQLEQTAQQIQNLMDSCLSECGPEGPTEISLCDIIIQKYQTVLIRNYTPDNVISLTIDMGMFPTKNDILKGIAQFSQLEFLCVYDSGYSRNFSKSLVLLLEQINVNVKNLSLINNTSFFRSCLEPRIFNLSKHSQLQSIHLYNVWCILGSGMNNLKSFYLSTYSYSNIGHRVKQSVIDNQVKEQFSSSFTQTLKKAVFLRHLTLKNKNSDCNFNNIFDLSQLSQLQSIRLEGFLCTFGSDIKYLETVYISKSYSTNKQRRHEFCEHLSSVLGKAVSLKKLHLEGTQCNVAACEGHTIALSGNVRLQSIHLFGYFCTFGPDIKSLEKVYIGGFPNIKSITHEFCEHLSSSLGKAVSLKQLYLNGIQCNSAVCEGHIIDLSGHVQLQSIEFVNCAFILKNNANGARNLKIFLHFNHSFNCERLLLKLLSKAVSIKHLTLKYSGYFKGLLDLSKYDQLQSIQFEGDFSVSGLSTKSLEKVTVNCFSDLENLIYLCSGSKLKELEISAKETFGNEIFTSGTNLGIQNLEYLESLKVMKLHIDNENALYVSPRMQNINHISFHDVRMSLQAWRKFVDSLRTLKQTVHVSCYNLIVNGNSIVC